REARAQPCSRRVTTNVDQADDELAGEHDEVIDVPLVKMGSAQHTGPRPRERPLGCDLIGMPRHTVQLDDRAAVVTDAGELVQVRAAREPALTTHGVTVAPRRGVAAVPDESTWASSASGVHCQRSGTGWLRKTTS